MVAGLRTVPGRLPRQDRIRPAWDEPALHCRSCQLLAEDVMPKLRAHVASLPLAAE